MKGFAVIESIFLFYINILYRKFLISSKIILNGGPSQIRTDDQGVADLCLNSLATEPYGVTEGNWTPITRATI